MIVRVLLSRTLSQYANVYVEAESVEAAEAKVQSRLDDPQELALYERLYWEEGTVAQDEYICDSEIHADHVGMDAAVLR